MMIQVHFADNTYDYVNEQELQRLLINQSNLIRFKRSSGWVVVGYDELRKTTRNEDYKHLVKAKKIIRVLYNDNRYDYVTDEMLDDLIDSEKVARFERSTGWATVGVDPVRKTRRG
jgi:hypothetical protein